MRTHQTFKSVVEKNNYTLTLIVDIIPHPHNSIESIFCNGIPNRIGLDNKNISFLANKRMNRLEL